MLLWDHVHLWSGLRLCRSLRVPCRSCVKRQGMTAGQPPREQCVIDALRTHAEELRRFVLGRVPAADVDDILQMAALRAVERADSLDDPSRVRAWLFTIHRNLMTDTLRQQARRDRLLDALKEQEPVLSSPSEAHCDCSVVQAGQLRPAYAAVLTLIDAGGASLAEAAQQLDISVNNAAVRLHRARRALRQAMHDHCGVQSAQDCRECRCVFEGCCVA